MKTPIFVYGTVMSGGSNHHYLDDAIFGGECLTEDADYKMVDMLMYPAVTHGATQIRGEVYLAPETTIKHLDRLEQNGHFYQRRLVEIEDFSVPAWMYILMDGILACDIFQTIQPKNNISSWRDTQTK